MAGPAKKGKAVKRNTKDSQRVRVEMPAATGKGKGKGKTAAKQYARMTQRAATKGKFKEADPTKDAKNQGVKGTKSIALVFANPKTVKGKKSSLAGSRYSIPVPGNYRIEDMAKLAKQAKALAFISPGGRKYSVGKGTAAKKP